MKLEADEARWFDLPVASFRYPVLLVHHDHEMLVDLDDESPRPLPLRGLCCGKTRRIFVNASMGTDSIHEAVHHESIHAVLYETLPSRLLNSKIAADMEEVFTHTVSPILCRVAKPRWPAFPPEARAVIRAARRRRGHL